MNEMTSGNFELLMLERLSEIYKNAPERVVPSVFAKEGDTVQPYIFVSYSHKDVEKVFSALTLLSNMNASFWYDKEGLSDDKNTADWTNMINETINDPNCRGVLFFVSKNSFVSNAVFQELEAFEKRMHNEQSKIKKSQQGKVCVSECGSANSFGYKIIMLDGNDLFDIQSKCTLEASFTSKRLIKLHSWWGTDKHYVRFDDNYIFVRKLFGWFNSLDCVRNEYNIKFDEDCLIVNGKLISYRSKNLTQIDKAPLLDNQGITSIGSGAFYCNDIQTITIPEGVKYIEDFAFFNCRYLKTLNLPASLERMGKLALANIHYQELNVDEKNKYIRSKNNCIYLLDSNGDCKTLFATGHCQNKNNHKSKFYKLEIDDNVVNFDDFAITDNNFIRELVLPTKLVSLGFWSVARCSNLQVIHLFPATKYISNYTFEGTTNIKEVYLYAKKGTINQWYINGEQVEEFFKKLFPYATIFYVDPTHKRIAHN